MEPSGRYYQDRDKFSGVLFGRGKGNKKWGGYISKPPPFKRSKAEGGHTKAVLEHVLFIGHFFENFNKERGSLIVRPPLERKFRKEV
jgi:hypothetical protein